MTTDVSFLAASLELKYQAIETALRAGSLDAVAEIFADGFVAYDGGGQRASREQVLAELDEMMRTLRDIRWARKITRLTLEGSDAAATVEGVLRAVTDQGKRVEMKITTEDVWIFSRSGWHLLSSRRVPS
jgi:hypothetical protein